MLSEGYNDEANDLGISNDVSERKKEMYKCRKRNHAMLKTGVDEVKKAGDELRAGMVCPKTGTRVCITQDTG